MTMMMIFIIYLLQLGRLVPKWEYKKETAQNEEQYTK